MAFKLITMGVLCQMERRFVSLSIDSRFFFFRIASGNLTLHSIMVCVVVAGNGVYFMNAVQRIISGRLKFCAHQRLWAWAMSIEEKIDCSGRAISYHALRLNFMVFPMQLCICFVFYYSRVIINSHSHLPLLFVGAKNEEKKMRGLIHKGSGDKHDIYRINALRMSI